MKAIFLLASAILLTTSFLHAAVQTKVIEYHQGDQVLEGFLAWDDAASGQRPGVLVVHEWTGLGDYVKGRAVQLANLGYVAFALDMYGAGVIADDPTRAGELAGQFYGKPLMAERARAGLDQRKAGRGNSQPGLSGNRGHQVSAAPAPEPRRPPSGRRIRRRGVRPASCGRGAARP